MSLDVLDEHGHTPLIAATLSCHLESVQYLKDSGADVNLCSSIIGTALHVACSRGDVNIVNTLLKGGADCSIKGPSNQTCLYVAAANGQTEVIKVLMQHRQHLDESNSNGLTPLHIAVSCGHTETALYLIHRGANVSKIDANGNLPLHYAVKTKNVRIAKALVTAGSSLDYMNSKWESPLHLAICSGHIPTIWLLTGSGCNVNQCKPDGSGVLHLLVSRCNENDTTEFRLVLETLLLTGLDPNTLAYNTLETPLYQAIGLRKNDVAEILMAYGADPNISCPFGVTALELSSRNNSVQTVQMILNCGVNWRREKWLIHEYNHQLAEPQSSIGQILAYKEHPVSLQNLCRLRIRKHYEHNLFPNLESMKSLPLTAKNYVMLADISHKPVTESAIENISKWYSEADEMLGLVRSSPSLKTSDLLE